MRSRTRQKIDRVLALIEDGVNITEACRAGGVGRSTFYEAAKADPDILDALKRAEERRSTEMSFEAVAAVRKGFDGNWQAAAWWLERNYPEKFSLNPHLRRPATEKRAEPVSVRERLARNPELRRAAQMVLASVSEEQGEVEAEPVGEGA